MPLETILPALASLLESIPGVEAVYYPHPDDENGDTGLPAKLVSLPCFVIVPVSGAQMFGGPNSATHELSVTLYMSAQLLPESYGRCLPYIPAVRDRLAGKQKLGLTNIDHAIPAPGNFYEGPGGITYAGAELTGVKFRVEVKENVTLTLAA